MCDPSRKQAMDSEMSALSSNGTWELVPRPMHVNIIGTHVDTKSKLGSGGTPVDDPTLYRSLAGALQYLTLTRPNIWCFVQQVCLFMHDPREQHFNALKRIMRYVRGYSLLVSLFVLPHLIVLSLIVILIGRVVLVDNLVSWSSKRQHVVSRSSAGADYKSVANVVAETTWVRNIILELHFPLTRSTVVFVIM
ncbi:ribonuclease H-like domain-containing protein [Tanacetum coccineum]